MMGDMKIPDELIDQLLGEYEGPARLAGPDGLINQLRKRLIERAAGVELERHLGYRQGAEAPEAQPTAPKRMEDRPCRTLRPLPRPPDPRPAPPDQINDTLTVDLNIRT